MDCRVCGGGKERHKKQRKVVGSWCTPSMGGARTRQTRVSVKEYLRPCMARQKGTIGCELRERHKGEAGEGACGNFGMQVHRSRAGLVHSRLMLLRSSIALLSLTWEREGERKMAATCCRVSFCCSMFRQCWDVLMGNERNELERLGERIGYGADTDCKREDKEGGWIENTLLLKFGCFVDSCDGGGDHRPLYFIKVYTTSLDSNTVKIDGIGTLSFVIALLDTLLTCRLAALFSFAWSKEQRRVIHHLLDRCCSVRVTPPFIFLPEFELAYVESRSS